MILAVRAQQAAAAQELAKLFIMEEIKSKGLSALSYISLEDVAKELINSCDEAIAHTKNRLAKLEAIAAAR